ncbi:hypothetical protein IHE44_0010933 [Lamprotornis superbus]|uniref:Uncharacterized protein n=1 Tax=Lamprotornis superbus TaxID=245042 RepID=A0A835NCR2_9PASS|nr:hypothetical protein IHE44_0010933 [Lamprotornis superbus]
MRGSPYFRASLPLKGLGGRDSAILGVPPILGELRTSGNSPESESTPKILWILEFFPDSEMILGSWEDFLGPLGCFRGVRVGFWGPHWCWGSLRTSGLLGGFWGCSVGSDLGFTPFFLLLQVWRNVWGT